MFQSFKLIIIILFSPIFLHGQFDVSIGTGSMWIDGDVDILCGIGSVNTVDVGLDYQLINHFYFGGNIGYGEAKGLEQYRAWQHVSSGGGLVEDFYDDYEGAIYAPYHATKILSASMELSYKMYLSHDNLYLRVGFQSGYSKAGTYMNLYDTENNIYNLPQASGRLTQPIYPPSLFDDSFESKMDLVGTFFHYGPSVSIGFNVTKNGYLGIGYSVQITNTDYLDGMKFRTALDRTNNDDIIHRATLEYTHRFGTFHW